MRCNNCEHLLPDDSEFCQYCGAKILNRKVPNIDSFNTMLTNDSELYQGCGKKLFTATVQEPSQPNDNTEELLFEVEVMEIKGSSPVIIQRVNLFCSADREKYYLRCNFKNLSNRVISALMIDVLCFDVWGNELSTIRDAQILDLSPQRDEVFGYSQKIPIVDLNTRTVKIKLKRIRFDDGTIEECSGEEIKVPAAISLETHLNSSELKQQYISETSPKAVVVPMQIGAFWMCSCRQINSAAEEKCLRCSTEKQIVFTALNKDFLSERYTEYIEKKRIQEEKLRQEQEERQLAEQQRKAEIERERIDQVQNERNLAIQKRIAATEVANKRKKKIKTIIIFVVVAIVAIFTVKEICDSSYRAELRNFSTDVMNDNFTNVYADVVSIEPEHFVYRYNTTKYGTKIGNGDLWEVVCKCKTVEGKTIWVTFFYQYYPEGDYSQNEDDYKSFTYNSDNPMRLIGSVDTAHEVIDELEDAIGNVFVLDVKEKLK